MTTPENDKPTPLLPAEKLVSEEHPELHHYTDEGGLDGILKHQKLWSVQYDQMNDPTEFDYIKTLLVKAIEPRMRAFVELQQESPDAKQAIKKLGGVDRVVAHEKDFWINALYNALKMDHEKNARVVPHITSFCKHTGQSYELDNGLLSQWRAYGGKQPYALVFNTKKLEGLIRKEVDSFEYFGANFSTVFYDDDDFDIDRQFPNLIEAIYNSWVLVSRGTLPKIESFIEDLIKLSIRIKHRGFHEEREVRIVTYPRLNRQYPAPLPGIERLPLKQQFTNKKLHIELFGNGMGLLPIKRIIVGPSRNQPAAIEKARHLSHGKINIVPSQTPYLPPPP